MSILFLSKMQELIDEHREQLSTEFVRLSMEECQKEFNKSPTEMIVVKIYFDKFSTEQGCTECEEGILLCQHTTWYNVAQIPKRLYTHLNDYFKDPLASHTFIEIRCHRTGHTVACLY